MSQTVHVLMITTRQGHELSAYSNGQAPLDALDRYVQRNWRDVWGSSEPMPETPGERIRIYFGENDREFYDIAECEIDKED